MYLDSQNEHWLREDVGHHDVTNDVPGETTGRLVAKDAGVVAVEGSASRASGTSASAVIMTSVVDSTSPRVTVTGSNVELAADRSDHPLVVEAPELLNNDHDLSPRFAAEKFTRLRRTMDENLGLERDPDEIARAGGVLRRLKGETGAYVCTRTARDLYELRNASVSVLLIARAAQENPTSVGCHYVVDDIAPVEEADDD